MAEPAPKENSKRISASNDALSSSSELLIINDQIKGRRSRELVIGLCGPIGSGIHGVNLQLQRVLKDEGYEVVEIRVSQLIECYIRKLRLDLTIDHKNRAERYEYLMDAGNRLREEFGPGICANLAISEVALNREQFASGDVSNSSLETSKKEGLKKRAYIIDQLKHPAEFSALKSVYNNIFYLVGVLCDEQRRETSLTTEGIEKSRSHELIVSPDFS